MSRKFSHRLLHFLLIFAILTPYFVGPAPLLVEAVKAETVTLDPFPSINEYNKSNSQPYVEMVSNTYDSVKLKFVNPKPQSVWFEFKIDSQAPTSNQYGPCRIGVDPLPSGCAGLRYLAEDDYSYSSLQVTGGNTIEKEYTSVLNDVSIRMTFGPERDWDFNWVTFSVKNPYPVPTYHSPADGTIFTTSLVKLVWYAPSGVQNSRHQVRYATSLEGLESAEVLTTNYGGQAVYKELTLPDGTYYWQMRSRNVAGTKFSEWATPRSFTINTHPDPEGNNQLSLGGNVYRDFSMNDCFGKTSCENKGESLGAGWVFNLYEENSPTEWTFLKTATTSENGKFSFSAVKEAGTYHFCSVVKDGWNQQVQNWGGTPYHIATANLSGNALEGDFCRTVVYDDKADRSNVAYFGFVDVQSPTAEIVAPNQANQDVLIKGVATDNHVIKSHWFEIKDPSGALFYKNFPSNSATEVTFNLTEATNGTDNLTITDGEYRIRYVVTDITGNRNDDPNFTNPTIHNLLMDVTAPSLIVLDAESKKLLTNADSILAKTTDVNGIRQIHANIYKVGEDGRSINPAVAQFPFNFDRNDIKQEIVHEIKLTGLEDGKYELRLASIDTLMNRTENLKHYFTIDSTAPEGNIVYSGGVLSDGVRYIKSINDLSFTGTFTDNNELDRTTYVVWKVDSDFKNRVGFCGNWHVNAITNVSVSGTSDSVNANVKDCAPSANWEDGYYEIGHRVYDKVGNYIGLNSPTEKFVIDSTAPQGSIVYSGGIVDDGVRYLQNIDGLSFTGDFTDNNGLDRTTYVVWKVDSNFKNRVLFCGNWHVNAITSASLSGISDSINANVKDCAPNANWEDGYYEIGHRVYDKVGLYLDLNAPTEKFVIDSTAPTMSNINMFVNGVDKDLAKPGDDIKIVADVTDLNGIDSVQIWVREWQGANRKVVETPAYMTHISGNTYEFNFTLANTYTNFEDFNQAFGQHYFNFQPKDILGNGSPMNRNHFTIDSIAPEAPTNLHRVLKADTSKILACGEVSILQGLEPHWDAYSGSDFLRYNYQTRKGHKDTSTVNWYDIGNWVPTVEGLNGFRVQTVDLAGNVSEWSEWCDTTFDNTAPDVHITYPSNNQHVNGTIEIRGTVEDDNLLRYYYNVNGISNTVYRDEGFTDEPIYNWNTTGLSDGEYTIQLEARDKAGNKDAGSVHKIKVIVDNTNPVLGISEVNVLSETEVEFTGFVFDENFNYYYCWLTRTSGGEIENTRDENCITTWAKDLQRNGNPATSTNEGDGSNEDPVRIGGFNITGLEEGDYIVHLGAKDKAGNLEIVSKQFTLDFEVEEESEEQSEETEETTEEGEEGSVLGDEDKKDGKNSKNKNKNKHSNKNSKNEDKKGRIISNSTKRDSRSKVGQTTGGNRMKAELTGNDGQNGVVFSVSNENIDESLWTKYQWWMLGLLSLVLLTGGKIYLTQRSKNQN